MAQYYPLYFSLDKIEIGQSRFFNKLTFVTFNSSPFEISGKEKFIKSMIDCIFFI